jgi:hypothetical protein
MTTTLIILISFIIWLIIGFISFVYWWTRDCGNITTKELSYLFTFSILGIISWFIGYGIHRMTLEKPKKYKEPMILFKSRIDNY